MYFKIQKRLLANIDLCITFSSMQNDLQKLFVLLNIVIRVTIHTLDVDSQVRHVYDPNTRTVLGG